jgi:transcriptional regulator with XRE-family HTH domain
MMRHATHHQEINMDQRISTISDLMNEMGVEKETVKQVTENIKNYSISQNLTILRAKANLSQSEMAKKMKTSQSFISKLESASNDQIKVDDMCTFLATLGYETTITISKPQNIAQKIKASYCQLVDLVKELQKYAVNDDAILEGIASFEIEATQNMLNLASMLIESSSAKLDKIHPRQEPQIILQNENVNKPKKVLASV